jgi:hypothetical protein
MKIGFKQGAHELLACILDRSPSALKYLEFGSWISSL